jgi:hypothetical protein
VQENEAYLKQYEPVAASADQPGKDRFYLRVINRVYLVKTVDVSLFSNRGFGAGATA